MIESETTERMPPEKRECRSEAAISSRGPVSHDDVIQRPINGDVVGADEPFAVDCLLRQVDRCRCTNEGSLSRSRE